MENKLVTLSTVPTGHTVKLAQISGGQSLRQRLAAMGLMPGEIITVVKNNHPGPFVIKVKQSKVAFGRGMAEQIKVKLIK